MLLSECKYLFMKSVLLFVLQEDRFGVVWGVKKGKLIGAATED